MNKQRLESLKELVKVLNKANTGIVPPLAIEAYPSMYGGYRVDITADTVICADNLRTLMSWAAGVDIKCWASACHSDLILHLR